jgi:hypothetical protein
VRQGSEYIESAKEGERMRLKERSRGSNEKRVGKEENEGSNQTTRQSALRRRVRVAGEEEAGRREGGDAVRPIEE